MSAQPRQPEGTTSIIHIVCQNPSRLNPAPIFLISFGARRTEWEFLRALGSPAHWSPPIWADDQGWRNPTSPAAPERGRYAAIASAPLLDRMADEADRRGRLVQSRPEVHSPARGGRLLDAAKPSLHLSEGHRDERAVRIRPEVPNTCAHPSPFCSRPCLRRTRRGDRIDAPTVARHPDAPVRNAALARRG